MGGVADGGSSATGHASTCALCKRPGQGLKRCTQCKAVSYCNKVRAHGKIHHRAHGSACAHVCVCVIMWDTGSHDVCQRMLCSMSYRAIASLCTKGRPCVLYAADLCLCGFACRSVRRRTGRHTKRSVRRWLPPGRPGNLMRQDLVSPARSLNQERPRLVREMAARTMNSIQDRTQREGL